MAVRFLDEEPTKIKGKVRFLEPEKGALGNAFEPDPEFPEFEEPEVGKAETFLKSLGSGVTLGLADKIAPTVTAGITSLFNVGGEKDFKTEQERLTNLQQTRTEVGKQQNPKSAIAGDLASFLVPIGAPAKITGAIGKTAFRALPKITKGKKFVKPLLTALSGGTSEGVVEGVKKGVKDESITSGLKQGVKSFGAGFAGGAVLGGGSALLKSKSARQGLSKFADKFRTPEQIVAKNLKTASKAGKFSQPLDNFEKGVDSQAPKKTLKEKIFGDINEQDRSIMSETLKPKDTPITDYAVIAEDAIKNPRNLTPMDFANTKQKKAFDALSEKVRIIGADKGAILEEKGLIAGNTDELLSQWDEILNDRLGIARFDNGKVVMASGRELRDAGSVPLVKKINGVIERLGDNATMQQLDDAKASIRSIVERESATQVKQIATIGEGIGKNIRKEIDNILIDNLGDEYRQINKQFSRLKTVQSNMNRRLGNTIDATGQTVKGSGLLKSAIQSNTDSGAKAMFRQILEETGYDLIKDAKFAEITMSAVNDPRILSLLKEVGGSKISKFGVAGELASAIGGKLKKDKLGQIKDFSIKSVGRKKTPPKPKKPSFFDFPNTRGLRGLGALESFRNNRKEENR